MILGRMVPVLPLIVLLMIYRVYSADKAVNYNSPSICALKDSSVIISCNFTFPPQYPIETVFWTIINVKNNTYNYPDLSKDPEYSQRLQYLGDKQQNCTVRLSNVTKKDENRYYFRFTTNVTVEKWLGKPGVSLSITDLQVESPERVTEGDSVRLACNSSCTLTDTPTFIWYRNSQPLTERRGRNNELLLQSVRREDAGRYRCAVHGHTLTSPDVNLNVTYPPRNISVSITDSVSLSCISDSNPPAEISWFKEDQSSSVGSGQSFSAVQSGRFYCEARNPYGFKISEAVTVTVKGHLAILCISIGVVCAAVVVITVFLMRKRRIKRKINESQMNQSRPHQDRSKDCDADAEFMDAVYGNITMNPLRPHDDSLTDDDADFTDHVYGNVMNSIF